ncbi:MAG: sporulation protein [Dehalococcoidia bacterium]
MKVNIQTEKPSYHQGEQVKGELVIAADEKGLSGDSIILKLNEYWWHSNVQAAGTGWKDTKLDEVVLQQSFDFPAGTEHRFPFTLQLTKNCRITRLAANGKGHEKCGFEVELKGVKHKDRKHEFPLEVLPGREFLAIIETCKKKWQLEERPNNRFTEDNRDHTLHFTLYAKEPYDFGFLALFFRVLQADNSGIEGQIVVALDKNLRRGFTERILGFLGMNPDEKIHFQLTASQLFLPDGTANHTAIARAIEEIIESVMAPRRRGGK